MRRLFKDLAHFGTISSENNGNQTPKNIMKNTKMSNSIKEIFQKLFLIGKEFHKHRNYIFESKNKFLTINCAHQKRKKKHLFHSICTFEQMNIDAIGI